jgi:hypothetical protein
MLLIIVSKINLKDVTMFPILKLFGYEHSFGTCLGFFWKIILKNTFDVIPFDY